VPLSMHCQAALLQAGWQCMQQHILCKATEHHVLVAGWHAGIKAAVEQHKPKMVFLTSPNNPDGSLTSTEDLLVRVPHHPTHACPASRHRPATLPQFPQWLAIHPAFNKTQKIPAPHNKSAPCMPTQNVTPPPPPLPPRRSSTSPCLWCWTRPTSSFRTRFQRWHGWRATLTSSSSEPSPSAQRWLG
jgi:hypothetical protein